MATSNFKKPRYFDILAHECCYELGDTGEYEFDYQLCEEIEDTLQKLNKELNFFNLILDSGYYSGIQVIPAEIEFEGYTVNDILNYYDEIDGQDIYSIFGYNKHILRQKIYKEIKYINDTIFNDLKRDFRFERLGIIARFSNGETMYGRI